MLNQEFRVQRIAWGDAGFRSARDAEFRLFGVANSFVTDKDLAAHEMVIYRPYEKKSEFYVAYGVDAPATSPIAIIRFIRFDPERGLDSFCTLKDARSYSADGGAPACYLDLQWDSFFGRTDPSTIGELATQAVDVAHRRGGIVEHLWDAIVVVSEREGVSMWTVALVVPLFRWYKAVFPNAIQAIGRVMPQYVGADSIPAVVRIDHPEIKEYVRRFRAGSWKGIATRACRLVASQATEQEA